MRRRIVLYLTYDCVRMYFKLLVNHIFIGMLSLISILFVCINILLVFYILHCQCKNYNAMQYG